MTKNSFLVEVTFNNPVYVGFLYTLIRSLFDELSFKISKNGSWLFFSFSIVNLILGCCPFRKVKKRSASVSHLKRQKMSSTYHL